jgi:hypothetical protein
MTTAVELIDVPLNKNTVRKVKVGEETYTGVLSSFDFPSSLRIHLSDSGERAFVEFIYASAPEATSHKIEADDVLLEVGASGRILAMDFPLTALVPGNVAVGEKPFRKLKAEAGSMDWDLRPARRLAHYKMLPDLFPLIGDSTRRLRERWFPGHRDKT